jgi:protein SCO1/2
VITAVATAFLAGCGGSSKPAATSTTPAKGASLEAPGEVNPPTPAPAFSLRDSTGKVVSLSQFKGKAVLLTFLYTNCPDVCPLIVAQLHSALLKLGPSASEVQIIAVSVDPKRDTPRAVNAFLAKHDMTGRMKYLVGSTKELASVWKPYGIEVQSTPEQREVGHTGIVYAITANGIRRAVYPTNLQPNWIAHDVPILAAS